MLNGENIKGLSYLGSAAIKVNRLVPYIILCQHSGSIVTPEIEKKMLLSSFQRSYEKDLYLDKLLDNHSINITARHSRYEFDTNRFENMAIYSTPELSWGVKVYKDTLNQSEIESILFRYREFYNIVELIVSVIIERFGICVIYDLHSFNMTYPERIGRDLPLFNLGTMAANTERYRVFIDAWLKQLNLVKIKGVSGHARENDLFGGRGGMAYHISKKFPEALLLPTEIRKFYMNEKTLEIYEDLFLQLQLKLNNAVKNHVEFVAKKQGLKNYF